MRLKLQVLTSSFASSNKFTDLYSEAYLVITSYLQSLKESANYRSRRRVYISKKTGKVKEYFSDEKFSLDSFSYSIDLLFPGGPVIVLDTDTINYDHRIKILKRFLYEKAKLAGIYIYIFPYYRSLVKRKIIGYTDDMYKRIFSLSSLEEEELKSYFSTLNKYEKYINTLPHYVHLINWINYHVKGYFKKDFGLNTLTFQGEPVKEAKELYLNYIKKKDIRYLNKLFVLLTPNNLIFRAFSDAYCINGNYGDFLENYLKIPFLEDDNSQREIRERIYQSAEGFYNSQGEHQGFYSKLRDIFDYFIFLSNSMKEFIGNMKKVFDEIKFNKYYFTFSFRSISNVSISFQSIGFNSVESLERYFGKVPEERFLSIKTYKNILLDEIESALLSKFL